MNNKKWSLSFYSRIYLTNLLLLLAGVILTGALGLFSAISVKQKAMDHSIRSLSLLLSQLPSVREALTLDSPSEELKKELDLFSVSFDTVDVVVVCDLDSIRLYHTIAERVGQHFVGEDEDGIFEGKDEYISVATGTMGLQRRAFHSVRDEDGTLLGFVICSVLNSRMYEERSSIIQSFLLILLLLVPISLLLSSASLYQLRSLLMGFEPEEFSEKYVERNEVLNALEEGIFGMNAKGEVTVMNQEAKRILDLPEGEAAEGRLLADLFPESRLPATLKSGVAEHNIDCMIHDKNILASRIPIKTDGKIIGAVSICRNKTELTKLAEELTGAKYMVDTLRAFNHEFMNKLHIILGLLEVNNIHDAKNYIMQTSLVSGEAVSAISHRVPISTLAALLIGKLIRANELGIQFSLKADSYFYPKATHLPTDCYITLIGNLVENAMDELNTGDFPIKRIELGIYSEEGHTIICCDDTGGGIPEEILFSIYNPHTTTKGEGHGTGFFLMRQIVDRYEGTFHIDTELGEGSSIEIILPV